MHGERKRARKLFATIYSQARDERISQMVCIASNFLLLALHAVHLSISDDIRTLILTAVNASLMI